MSAVTHKRCSSRHHDPATADAVPLAEFSKNKRAGLEYECRQCKNTASADHRKAIRNSPERAARVALFNQIPTGWTTDEAARRIGDLCDDPVLVARSGRLARDLGGMVLRNGSGNAVVEFDVHLIGEHQPPVHRIASNALMSTGTKTTRIRALAEVSHYVSRTLGYTFVRAETRNSQSGAWFSNGQEERWAQINSWLKGCDPWNPSVSGLDLSDMGRHVGRTHLYVSMLEFLPFPMSAITDLFWKIGFGVDGRSLQNWNYREAEGPFSDTFQVHDRYRSVLAEARIHDALRLHHAAVEPESMKAAGSSEVFRFGFHELGPVFDLITEIRDDVNALTDEDLRADHITNAKYVRGVQKRQHDSDRLSVVRMSQVVPAKIKRKRKSTAKAA